MPTIIETIRNAFTRHALPNLPIRVWPAAALEMAVELLDAKIDEIETGGETPDPVVLPDPRDGRTITEVATPEEVTDISAKFVKGGTFTRDPSNRRHDTIKVCDESNPLTANMTINLNVAHADNSRDRPIIIRKGDLSAYKVRVSGFYVSGVGTVELTAPGQAMVCSLVSTNNDDGPGPGGTKYEVSLITPAVDGETPVVSGSDGLGVMVTQFPYSMPTDGTGDCSAILEDIIEDGHKIIWFPKGRYNFPTKVDIPAATSLVGAGWQDCEILAGGDWWIECFRSHVADVTTDWCRCSVSGFLINMAVGGIRFWGHEFRASELRFSGGGDHMDMGDSTTWIVDPDAWCIEGIAANELYIGRISGGYGGNNGVNTLFANGIRLTALDQNATEDLANYISTPAYAQNQRGVNYGDGLIEEVSLKGRAKGWKGLYIGHESTDTGVQNMLQVQRVQVQAGDVPSALNSDPTMAVDIGGGLYAWKDSVGVTLKRVRRCLFEAVNTETSEVAWDLIGNYRYDDEDPPAAISVVATERCTFIACPTMNSLYNYRDNNGTITGAVKDNHFQGGQSFGPMQPTGVSTDEEEGAFDIMAGVMDTYLPGQLWLSKTQTGLPNHWIRVSTNEDLLIGVIGSPDPGNVLEDSHPRNDYPRRAIGIRTAFNNEVGIFVPMAEVQGRDARLKLGNGEDDEDSGPLEAIILADPTRFSPRETLPTLTGELSRGTVLFADLPAAMGGGNVSRWVGPNLYAYLDRGTSESFNGHFVPIALPPGYIEAHLGRAGSAYSVDEEWFGRVSEHISNVDAATITIPADLVTDKFVDGTKVPRSSRSFHVFRRGTAAVKLAGGTNVTLYGLGVSSNEYDLVEGEMVQVVYTRNATDDFRVFIMGSKDLAAPATAVADTAVDWRGAGSETLLTAVTALQGLIDAIDADLDVPNIAANWRGTGSETLIAATTALQGLVAAIDIPGKTSDWRGEGSETLAAAITALAAGVTLPDQGIVYLGDGDASTYEVTEEDFLNSREIICDADSKGSAFTLNITAAVLAGIPTATKRDITVKHRGAFPTTVTVGAGVTLDAPYGNQVTVSESIVVIRGYPGGRINLAGNWTGA